MGTRLVGLRPDMGRDHPNGRWCIRRGKMPGSRSLLLSDPVRNSEVPSQVYSFDRILSALFFYTAWCVF